jgi:hypothetical protein
VKFDCPICHAPDAIVAHWSVSGGTYWDPPEYELETSQKCACHLSDDQWETIERITADNPDDPGEHDDLPFADECREPAA